jgi:exodeoxyribonuclease-3
MSLFVCFPICFIRALRLKEEPASRQAFAQLLTQGWTDALRTLQPEGPLWTFWDYKRDRWQADKGMRLDHLLLSPEMSARLTGGGVDRWVRGEENASDHAPAWVILDLDRIDS